MNAVWKLSLCELHDLVIGLFINRYEFGLKLWRHFDNTTLKFNLSKL